MSNRILATALLTVLAAPAPALANGTDWANKTVRVQFGSDQTPAVTGKVTRLDRCLYVRFDEPRSGITMIRMDQVRRLEVRNGAAWVAQDVKAVLGREPAHCFAEANG